MAQPTAIGVLTSGGDAQGMNALFEKEGGDLFDVQQVVLGQLAQGGNPSPLDRALATRLAAQGIDRLIAEADAGRQICLCAGNSGGDVIFRELEASIETDSWRPDDQWWRGLRPILDVMAQPGPRLAERAV